MNVSKESVLQKGLPCTKQIELKSPKTFEVSNMKSQWF